MHIYGQLVRAQLEQWSADPTPGTNSRVGYNYTTLKIQVDDGTYIQNVLTDRSLSPLQPFNHLYNSDFRIWQRGTSATVTSAANPATPEYLYLADRWYVNNVLGGGTVQGVITYSQVAGTFETYAAQVQITTAPTGTNIQNGCELYQVLEIQDSQAIYAQIASFAAQVKSLGNVTSVGLQFCYSTIQSKPTVFIGSETIVTVNSSGFTNCATGAQSLGFAQTLAGVLGVRIRIAGVSTGHAYDVSNGFIVEQASLNNGANAGLAGFWHRRHASFASELSACQRYYEKSYDDGVNPGTVTTSSNLIFTSGMATSSVVFISVPFKVAKIQSGTGTFYSPASGSSGKIRNITASADLSVLAGVGLNSMGCSGSLTDANLYTAHWTCDAEF